MKKNIVLVGAGISGLSSLYFFLKKNAKKIDKVEIFEKEREIGGVLRHTNRNGFIFEHGAQGVLSSRVNFSSLVAELNLKERVCATSPKKAHRAFLMNRKIVRLSPKNLIEMFRENLISIPIILRILGEFFVKKQNDINKNETVEEFFSRHFGKKFSSHFLAPVMKGIWGGGMSRILVRWAFPSLQRLEQEHSSILKSLLKRKKSKAKKEMLSFVDGMNTLPRKLLKEIQDICTKEKILFKLNLHSEFSTDERDKYDLVIYSAQPWKDENFCPHNLCSVNKIKNLIQSATDVLRNIPTHSLVVVGIGSSNKHITKRLDGFGALAVENNFEGVLGVIAVHSLNANHMPNNSFLYRIMMGGENMPNYVNFETCSNLEIIQLAKNYLEKYDLLDKEKTYDFEHVVRHINYLPLPTEYQEKVLEAVSTLEKLMPGVFFTGNYLAGPAIDVCLEQAYETAEKISKYMAPNKK